MLLRIQILDDEGNIKAQAEGPAWQPVQWKCLPNAPIVVDRGNNNGQYQIFTVTAQPICTLVMGASQTPVQFPQNPPSMYPPVSSPGMVPGMYPKNPLGSGYGTNGSNQGQR